MRFGLPRIPWNRHSERPFRESRPGHGCGRLLIRPLLSLRNDILSALEAKVFNCPQLVYPWCCASSTRDAARDHACFSCHCTSRGPTTHNNPLLLEQLAWVARLGDVQSIRSFSVALYRGGEAKRSFLASASKTSTRLESIETPWLPIQT